MEQFGVKAVSQRTGINPHTLRIWERRYSAVEPARTSSGRRVYDRAAVEKLSLLAFLVGKGHAISRLAQLGTPALETAVAEARKSGSGRELDDEVRSAAERQADERLLGKLMAALEGFQLRALGAQLTMARTQMGARAFTFAIVSPLLATIGKLVSEGHLSIAHEHALSALLKTHIYQMLSSMAPAADALERRRAPLPSITVATQEGDYHEFGILLAALLMMNRQFPVHFFGANMPATPLAHAANALRSEIVLVGKTIPCPVNSRGQRVKQKDFLKELDQALIPGAAIWVGGHIEVGGTRFKARHNISLFSTLEMLDARLSDLASTARPSELN